MTSFLKNGIAAFAFTLAGFASNADAVEFMPEKNETPTEIILFSSSSQILELHKSLISELPTTSFVVVFPSNSENTKDDYAEFRNVKTVDYHFPLTDWVQDRIVRFEDGSITSSFSDMAFDTGYTAYEMGIPQFLAEKGLSTSANMENMKFASIDKKNGEAYMGKSDVLPTVSFWNGIYGDGGDRISNAKYVFVGGSTLEKIKRDDERYAEFQNVVAESGKEIVQVDSSVEAQRFGFHIDMFMTVDPNNPDRVFLANPEYTLKEVFGETDLKKLPEFVDNWYYAKKMAQYKLVRDQFEAKGFEIVDTPVMYVKAFNEELNVKQNMIMTFNNGIFAKNKFMTANYNFGNEVDAYTAKAREMTKTAFADAGFDVAFLNGGQDAALNFGVVRCSSAVTSYDQAVAFKPVPVEIAENE